MPLLDLGEAVLVGGVEADLTRSPPKLFHAGEHGHPNPGATRALPEGGAAGSRYFETPRLPSLMEKVLLTDSWSLGNQRVFLDPARERGNAHSESPPIAGVLFLVIAP